MFRPGTTLPASTSSNASSVPPIAPEGQPAAEGLRQRHEVGRDAEALDRAAGRNAEPCLDLVEDQHHPERVVISRTASR